MASIVTYDVPEKHVELKKAMFKLGYKEEIAGNTCEVIYFPNTTLYHESKNPKQAKMDVQTTCIQLNVDLERCVATIWDDWSVICGEPYK